MRRSLALLTLLVLGCAMLPAELAGDQALAQGIRPELAADPAVIAAVPVGQDPQGLAVDEQSGRVYVANLASSDVSVVDIAARQERARIPVQTPSEGWGPEAVAVDAARSRFYVVDTTGDITVFDTTTNSQVGTVKLGASPFVPMSAAVAVDSGRGVLISLLPGDSKGMAAVNLDTLEVLSFFPSLIGPLGLGIDVNAGRLYASESSMGRVTVIDVPTLSVLPDDTIEGLDSPFDAAFYAADNRLYVTSAFANMLHVLNTHQHQLEGRVTVPACYSCSFVAVANERARVYYTAAGKLLVIDANTNAIISSRTFGPGASDIAVSEGRGEVYLLDRDRDVLIAFDADQLDSPPPALPAGGGPPSSASPRAPLVAGAFLLAAGMALLSAALRPVRQ